MKYLLSRVSILIVMAMPFYLRATCPYSEVEKIILKEENLIECHAINESERIVLTQHSVKGVSFLLAKARQGSFVVSSRISGLGESALALQNVKVNSRPLNSFLHFTKSNTDTPIFFQTTADGPPVWLLAWNYDGISLKRVSFDTRDQLFDLLPHKRSDSFVWNDKDFILYQNQNTMEWFFDRSQNKFILK